ncbi:hypothetical protein MATL_G00188870 [Megalops atlanticus]|uniref:PAS domain-containing protein n=1 Tax=Megalops atlanticus TaxID=7932 RepID=A0A9D3SZY8_MEGAT|nr:hypothetical protein MATL_G00188870 [Megalops atlanticus]
MVLHRSTKGASKARRDHINGEIRNMRALLPISPEDRERLSYLHSMSAICAFIRKSIFYRELQAEVGASSPLPYEDFLQALPGFIVAMTREGKLIYVSENVMDYLGYSMVDVLQGDTFYDMVESADVDMIRSCLETDTMPTTERAFVCRMHTSKPFRLRQGSSCSVLVRGRLQATPQSPPSCPDLGQAFVALCTPTVNRLWDSDSHCLREHFQSLHQPDMTFAQVSDSVLFHLGYSAEEMIGRSWYSLLHPDDLSLSASGHRSLQKSDEDTLVEMVLRLQCKDLSWAWLYIRAARDSGKQTVSCTNYIISATEATFLKQKIYNDAQSALRPLQQKFSQHLVSNTPQCQTESTGRRLKRHRETHSPSEEPRSKSSRVSEPHVHYFSHTNQASDGGSPTAPRDGPTFPSTPPYSPASSHSSALQEDASSDFLLDTYSYTEDFLSPSESSPPYFPCHSGLSRAPGTFSPPEPLQTIPDHAFDLSSLGVMPAQSPEPHTSPSYNFPSCSADARLVPDCLPMPEACGAASDCAFHPEGFSLPAHPPGGAGPFLAPQGSQSASQLPAGLLTPDPSPTTESCFQYSEEERVEISILAQQISSLASSFDTYCGHGPALSLPAGYSKPSSSSIPALAPQMAQPPPSSWPHPATQPLKPELVLDEDVIDSILKDLDTVSEGEALTCSRPSSGCCPADACGRESDQQALDALEVRPPALSFATLMDGLPLGQLPSPHTSLDPCILTPGCHDDANELYQLNQYLHSTLHQDGLVEESMY